MFCLVSHAEKDGFGKIVELEGANAVVEYFDSPATEARYRISVAVSSIRRKRLGRNTRVFTFDEISNRWSIGRVRDDDGEGIEVRLAHRQDIYLSYDKVFVRWKRPINDPVDFLARFVTETPQYAEARSGFLQSYISQRGAAFGISALMSSAIELEPHQVEVVRRVLTDHTQRYLLADEVGLGKTIEAGIVIRQTVLDDMRGHKVVVLVPRQLVTQWREELIFRFGLADFVDDSVLVLSQEEENELRAIDGNLSLLVIDEAHHLTASNASESELSIYKLVKDIAHSAEKLLLLSATPILRNEGGFLRMLNLLDPVVYPLSDLEGFRAKVANRQVLAETVAALDPSNSLFMDSVIDDLLSRLPNDSRLTELAGRLKEQLLDLPDETNAEFCNCVRQVRAHISETYRLSRRILRNRRAKIEGLTPDRNGSEVWQVPASSMDRVESALEQWRIEASLTASDTTDDRAGEFAKFYWNAICALFENPRIFVRDCIQRIENINNCARSTFVGEAECLNRMLQAFDIDNWMNCRLDLVYRKICDLPEAIKVVIFCSNEESADHIFEYLKGRSIRVVRHGCANARDQASSWREFLDVPEVRGIICDRIAEEGINLQGGRKAIVHFDVPLQPNRVEQRIGRVDRYGSGNPVVSYVVCDENSTLQKAWFRILDEGLGVFDRSISSLQYLVEGEIASLAVSLLHEGAEGLNSVCDRLAGSSGEVARELRLIDQQDALDELSPVPEEELDNLFEEDGDWKAISAAMTYWIEETLLFEKVKETLPSGKSPIDQPFRFHYLPPDDGSGRATLISLSGFIEDFLGAIDFDAPGNRSSRPKSYPYVVHRPSAVRHRIRPLRYGTEFIEAIRSFTEFDDRGRSYAMWRQVFDEFEPMEIRVCLRFDFLVETSLKEAVEVLEDARGHVSASEHASLARRGDTLYQPTVIRVWLDEDGDELSTEFVERYLDPEYSKNGGDGYIDKNLDASYLTALKSWSPNTLINWRERCERMRDKAKSIILSKPEFLEQQTCALRRASAEEEIRYAQLRTRIRSLDGREAVLEAEQFSLEQSLNDALHRGISSASVKVDVAGAVFLTSEPVSRLDGYLGGQDEFRP